MQQPSTKTMDMLRLKISEFKDKAIFPSNLSDSGIRFVRERRKRKPKDLGNKSTHVDAAAVNDQSKNLQHFHHCQVEGYNVRVAHRCLTFGQQPDRHGNLPRSACPVLACAWLPVILGSSCYSELAMTNYFTIFLHHTLGVTGPQSNRQPFCTFHMCSRG